MTGRGWPGRRCSKGWEARLWAIPCRTGSVHRIGEAMKRKACFLVAFLMLAGTSGAGRKLPVQALPDAVLAVLRGGVVLGGLVVANGQEQLVAVHGEILGDNGLDLLDGH